MCIAWDPTWTAIARETQVPRATVMAIFFVVAAAPAAHRPTAETIAISLGARKPDTADRVLGAMRARHILDDDNRPTAEWASGDAGVTKGDAGVTAAVTRSLTGAERQARYKARKRAEKCAVGGAEHTVGEVTSPRPLFLSFLNHMLLK